MNVEFERVSCENFLSIGPKTIWEIKDQGLVLITGDNQDSQTADSNGSGKSALFDALLWGLWGKTVRGYSGDDVVHRVEGKDCSSVVSFFVGTDRYQVQRFRKHKKYRNQLILICYQGSGVANLTEQTTARTQIILNEILGIDYDTFIRGPMMPQGSFKHFSQMTDAEMKHLLEQVLQIDTLAVAQKEVKRKIADLQSKMSIEQAFYPSVRDEIQSLEALIYQYKLEDQEFDKKKNDQLDAYKQEIGSLRAERKSLEGKSSTSLKLKLKKAEETLKEVEGIYSDLEEKWQTDVKEVEDDFKSISTKCKIEDFEISSLSKKLVAVDQLGGICPTCEQEVSDAAKKDVGEKIKKTINSMLDDHRKSEAKEHAASEMLCAIRKEEKKSLEKARSFVELGKDNIYQIKTEIQAAVNDERMASRLRRQEHSLVEKYNELERQKSPFKRIVKGDKDRLAGCKKKMVTLLAKIRGYEIKLDHLEFWKEGFGNKGLKSHILKSVAPFMNKRAKHHADTLTGGEIEITFGTQTTLKSGEIREQFSVQVFNTNGAATYEGNSVGEKGKADLAINFVFADLAARRARKAFPQRFFDEPFENLDESGVEAVMDLLTAMAVDAGSIFVVTHHQGMKGLFQKEIRVTKRGGKSSVTER